MCPIRRPSQPSPKTYNKETDHERTIHAKYRLPKRKKHPTQLSSARGTGGGRIELKGRPAFAKVSKLGMRLDIMFDPNTNVLEESTAQVQDKTERA